MKSLVMLVPALLALVPGAALAQVVAPIPMTGPAQGAMQQLHPPTPLDQVREQALRRSSPLPPPSPPAERWVPERQIYAPELGRTVVIPGPLRAAHHATSSTPSPRCRRTRSGAGATIIIPGGERPPADLRQGP